MAKLFFYYGAMGASKTASALMTNFNYVQRGQNPLLAKSGVDTRDGTNVIRSRIGLEERCITVEKLMTWTEKKISEYDVIIVDEVQFCTTKQIDFLSDIVDDLNIPVVCYGLRADFKNHFFEGSKRLMEIADKISEIKTICWCGRKATCNARYHDGEIVREGSKIVLGADDEYVALCRKHYKLGMLEPEE